MMGSSANIFYGFASESAKSCYRPPLLRRHWRRRNWWLRVLAAHRPDLPNGMQDWLAGSGRSLEQDLIGIALEAIATILESSELKSFWDEGGVEHADNWDKAVDELKQRLNKCS